MKFIYNLLIAVGVVLYGIILSPVWITAAQAAEPPLKVLMITGGGWHDYQSQKQILEEGLGKRANVEFTIDHEGGKDAAAMISRHENNNWGAEFDLVLYNMCFSRVEDAAWIERIVETHVQNQLPAVILHCGNHSYRAGTRESRETSIWHEFMGARTYQHESEHSFTVENMATGHPVMKYFPRTWHTPNGELYEIVELMRVATPLTRAYGVDSGKYHPNVWVHEYKGVRIFNSPIGHHNETMGHDVNINLVSAGLLWAAGKLEDDGTPTPGFDGEEEIGWVSIWDGESLDGWRASENTETFTVEDGKIIADGPRSHLFYEGPVNGGDFINFELKAEVYTYPNANSGIFFHTRFQETGWPRFGYEAQVNASHTDRRKTGSLYGVSDVTENSLHSDKEWFQYHIIVNDKNITFKVNGDVVMEFTEPEDREGTVRLNRGTIALQGHDPESRMYYRNLKIRVLPD